RETPDRQNIFWTNIFKFIEAYIDNIPENDKEITSGDSSEDDIHDIPKGKDSEYTISAFSDIISIKSDSPFFDRDKAISLLRKFINKLLKKYQFEPIIDGKKVPGDYLQMAINTPMGQVLNKLLQLILDKAISDIKDVKDLYSEMLQNNVVEAYVFLGLYFIYFYIAIPDDWTKEKTDGILADSSNSGEIQYWEIFFEGFIKSDQYLDYYDWMYEHYKRAIKVYSKLEDRRFANLIAQFFLEGKDKLDDKSLLKYCYNKSAFEIISGCVGYISFKINKAKNPTAEEIAEKEKTIPKARELWDFLWKEINNDKTRDSMKDFLPDILGLIPALDKLDVDNYERISQILDNVRPKITDTSHIFSDLICLVNKPNNDENRILYMGKIYKEIIETMDYFTIEDSHKETIEILAKHQSDSKIKDILNEIKNIYINKSWNKYMEWFQA
ncbi:MAG: hypothetical protein LBS81_06515, partial [Endomicrobium sp.]|nr:hypothetical protein [Endomicrobium sp.]